MRVLVVGASGPLGRSVAAELRATGHSVTGLSRSGSHDTVRLDVTDRALTAELIAQCSPDAVAYLARPSACVADDDAAVIGNEVDSLVRFAAQCVESSVTRFVFASSAAVYGTDVALPRREDDERHGDSAYSVLKIRSEDALATFAGALPVTSLRIFNIFGPGFSGSLVNRIAVGDGTALTVYDTDTYVRDYIHSSDVARAFECALESADPGLTTANVGTGIGTSNKKLLGLKPDLEFRSHPDSSIASFSVADPSFARSHWGFSARVKLHQSIQHPDEFF